MRLTINQVGVQNKHSRIGIAGLSARSQSRASAGGISLTPPLTRMVLTPRPDQTSSGKKFPDFSNIVL